MDGTIVTIVAAHLIDVVLRAASAVLQEGGGVWQFLVTQLTAAN